MKFELIKQDIGLETETDKEGNYSVNITLGFETDNDLIPPFSKDITVTSNNSQTGFMVDEQRQAAVLAFVEEINK
jgi:hypothetical protein